MPVTRSSAIAANILSDIVFFGIPVGLTAPVAPDAAAGLINGEAANEANTERSLLQAARPPHKPNAMTARKITSSPVPLRRLCRPIDLVSPEIHRNDLSALPPPVQPCGLTTPDPGRMAVRFALLEHYSTTTLRQVEGT